MWECSAFKTNYFDFFRNHFSPAREFFKTCRNSNCHPSGFSQAISAKGSGIFETLSKPIHNCPGLSSTALDWLS